MSKILDNTTGSNIVISDTGVTITPSTDYTIPPTDYWLWASSDDTIVHVGNGDIVVNDGSNNLSPSDGMDLIKGLFPNPITLRGNTDGTNIGNIGDKLKTSAELVAPPTGLTIDPYPPFCVMYRSEPFLNGSSPNLNVDGSTTPVVFTIKPTVTDEKWACIRLGFQIHDNGNTILGNFGGIGGGLTNGLLFEFKINGTTETFKNIKFNEQIMMHFTEGDHSDGNGGILNNTGFFQGHFNFDGQHAPLTMLESAADELKITVRDDLSSINLLRVALTYWKPV